MKIPPAVQPGDPFTATHWNEMRDAVASLRPHPGRGTFLRQNAQGFTIDYQPPPPLDHPFRATLGKGKILFTPGLVNGIEPKIGKTLLSGLDDKGAPLPEGPPFLSTAGSSFLYAVLEVTCNASGGIVSAEIKGEKSISASPTPFIGRTPLALLKPVAGVPVLFQIVYHNLGHAWIKPAQGIGRHFFWAA